MNDSNDEAVYYQKNWTKKLYIKHPYPDNYVDKSFLQFKKINGKSIDSSLLLTI